jgi:hypothetical protein
MTIDEAVENEVQQALVEVDESFKNETATGVSVPVLSASGVRSAWLASRPPCGERSR